MSEFNSIEEIREFIARRRRQILVHSIIYYRLDDCIVGDSQWAQWALELEEVQKKYPEIARECEFAKAFQDFDHSTGYNLPLDDPDMVHQAEVLLSYAKRRNEQ